MKKVEKLDKQGDIVARDEIVNTEVRMWAQAMIQNAGITVNVTGLENIPDKPVVFVANHQGNFDIPLLLGYLEKPMGFVAKVEILKLPLIRTWMKYLNCIFIDRKNTRQSIAALNGSSKLLDQGYSLMIFPEGTRSKGGEMGEFKQGAFKMAFSGGYPIVPLVIDGTYKAMEANGNKIKPATVNLKALPLIETSELDKAAQKALNDKVREMIKKEL